MTSADDYSVQLDMSKMYLYVSIEYIRMQIFIKLIVIWKQPEYRKLAVIYNLN